MPLHSEFAVSFFKSSSLATSPELLSALYVGRFKRLHFCLQQHHWRRCMWVGSAAKNCVYSSFQRSPTALVTGFTVRPAASNNRDCKTAADHQQVFVSRYVHNS
ncbi:hypothetical protein Hanom_Chr16g01473961 [Helianthus anomalus]